MKASPRYKIRVGENGISGSYISQVAFTPGDPKQLVLKKNLPFAKQV